LLENHLVDWRMAGAVFGLEAFSQDGI
jgi:hypothetical protein